MSEQELKKKSQAPTEQGAPPQLDDGIEERKTKFSSQGPFPPIAQAGVAQQTASERAFGAEGGKKRRGRSGKSKPSKETKQQAAGFGLSMIQNIVAKANEPDEVDQQQQPQPPPPQQQQQQPQPPQKLEVDKQQQQQKLEEIARLVLPRIQVGENDAAMMGSPVEDWLKANGVTGYTAADVWAKAKALGLFTNNNGILEVIPAKPDADEVLTYLAKIVAERVRRGGTDANQMTAPVEDYLRQKGITDLTAADVWAKGAALKLFTENNGTLKASFAADAIIKGEKLAASGKRSVGAHYGAEVDDGQGGKKHVPENVKASHRGTPMRHDGSGEMLYRTRYVEDDKARGRFKNHVQDGKLVENDGKLMDTTHDKSGIAGIDDHKGSIDGKRIFVHNDGQTYSSDPTKESRGVKEFLSGQNPDEMQLWHHSSVLAGQDVDNAGTIAAKDGYLKELTNYSGHYQPGKENLHGMLSELDEKGLEVGTATVGYQNDQGDKSNWHGGEFLASHGNERLMGARKNMREEIVKRGPNLKATRTDDKSGPVTESKWDALEGVDLAEAKATDPKRFAELMDAFEKASSPEQWTAIAFDLLSLQF